MTEKSKIERMKEKARANPERYKRWKATMSPEDWLNLEKDWSMWARPKQLPPSEFVNGQCNIWMILAGRGFGKTRTGAETIRDWIESGQCKNIALVADTAADARDIMVEGRSGLIAIAHPKCKPIYNPSQRKLEYPNGAVAHTYSAEAYEALRGPEHDGAWIDELAKMAYQRETWDNLMFGMRVGKNPRTIITTTPRPTKLMKELIADPSVVVTRGSMFENASNLPQSAIEKLKKKYEGTRIGRQELYAEMLEDNPNALFDADNIDEARVKNRARGPGRIVVAVDPAVTKNEKSDETGIIVAERKTNGDAYILADRSMKGTPSEWAAAVVKAYKDFAADKVIAETNNGGDLVGTIIKNESADINFGKVTATRGKDIRAEPISALYEQQRVHHVGVFKKLEDQMVQFDPTLGKKQDSPDRMDALVWALTELFGEDVSEARIWFL